MPQVAAMLIKSILNRSRLEPKNKTHDYEEGLQARVKDPLWMMGRQWQMEEYKACNGGSLVRVEVSYKTKDINKIISKLNSRNPDEKEFDSSKVPMEKIVESETDDNESEAWISSRLEYTFAAKKGDSYLSSKEYDGNYLDWFNFDLKKAGTIETDHHFALKPNPVSFSGMPNPRFWSFEDKKMDIGKVKRTKINYLQAMMMEFAFIYSNDWFIIPLQQKIGTLRKINQIKTIDSFGIINFAKPAIDYSQRNIGWEVFTLSKTDDENSDGTLFYMPNTVYKGLESDPLEKISFIRDELANLVWGVEHVYEDGSGKVINRNDEATVFTCKICNFEAISEMELISHIEDNHPHFWDVENKKVVTKDEIVGEGEPGYNFIGPLSLYQLMSYVPINWIPYLPKQKNSSGQFNLRRGRTIIDSTQGPQYKGQILKESKYLFEEEVPRAGVFVERVNQLVRDTDGEIHLWRSRKKNPDERRKTSGLLFDRLIKLK